jgi:hypothetical protein
MPAGKVVVAMKSLFVILTASLMLAALPMSIAATCEEQPPQEGVAHPLTNGHYLYLDATQPEKTGEWQDSNHVGGLQTSTCRTGTTTVYRADFQAKTLP